MEQVKKGVTIISSGSATATQVLDNHDLSKIVDTSDDWIKTRTGIRKRHISAVNSLSDLASLAAQKAILNAGLTPADIDMIILATSTPDDLFGSASQIQSMIGATKAVAFDLTAACSGFVFALITASQFIRNGVYENIVIIGADCLSRWVDWTDRTTCVLFGDGAGAVVCQASEFSDRLLGFEMCSNGKLNNALNLAYQGEIKNIGHNKQIVQGGFGKITMNGREVYRFAVNKVPEVIEKALFRADLTTEQIDWLILHQANQRIIEAVAERLNIPSWKIISNLSEYGNTSAASIPLALDEAVSHGKIRNGDTIVTSGFGAGLTWGAAIFKWGAFE
ncbi:3-oxoacyl-[acyl-carrier-protein] synthase [Geminocystis sp. NIES-3708]|uniref:beta-ketoacyl-ACP synthase III n=1 Tax=Geminocystis sp. NIES-3708 TaxID=1615909 RepID=UPI0005FC3AB5|nr:beta-ketoacyl-ACP synthase III [Geminocystis sp. NIES-3708]BAQ60567.1 3-oxoacyl-[acyl-carrier-protein] synthase [Geminocystis sp. NIES-3708]